MSNSTPNLKFPLLTTERYLTATEKAKKLVRARVKKPRLSDFSGEDAISYPRWLIRLVLIALAIVMAGSFWFSAGKQIAVVSLIIDQLPGQYNRLSELWSTVGIGSTLLVSELGSVLFLVSAGVFRESSGRVVAIILRVFAAGCASLAIMCNIAIAAIDTPSSVAAVSWFTSVLIPSIVLGLGVILEQVVLSTLRTRTRARVEYEIALRDYRTAINDPTQHSEYGEILTPVVYDELMRHQRDREVIVMVVTAYGFSIDMPDVQARIVHAEIDAHTSRNALTISNNPFLKRFETPETLLSSPQTPVLSAPVSETSETLSPAVQKAVDWLKQHPEMEGIPVREVARVSGISAPTLTRAKQSMKQKGNNNG